MAVALVARRAQVVVAVPHGSLLCSHVRQLQATLERTECPVMVDLVDPVAPVTVLAVLVALAEAMVQMDLSAGLVGRPVVTAGNPCSTMVVRVRLHSVLAACRAST